MHARAERVKDPLSRMRVFFEANERLIVETDRENHGVFSLFGSAYAYLELEIRVPVELALDVESGSGDVRAVEVRDLYLRSDPAHPRRFMRLQVER